MPGNRYSKEFKEEAVKNMLEKGISATQAASELGINANTMRSWARAYRENSSDAFVGSGNLRQADKEIKELNKRIKDLEEENAILKKAAAIFAQSPKK